MGKWRGTQLRDDQYLPPNYRPSWFQRQLESQILTCRKCEGLNIPKETMAAPGYGAITAELVVIGQSLHGYNPQTPKRQIPFIGPVESQDSGLLLYAALRKAGYTIRKGNVYITNVVKCHPPGNRSSRDEEKANCIGYLKKELKMIRPKAIMTVGADAHRVFNASMSSHKLAYVTRIFSHPFIQYPNPDGVYHIMTAHPSWACRKGSEWKEAWIQMCTRKLKYVKKRLAQHRKEEDDE